VIEDGVWIWPDARIQPGVRVAHGCIVSTASVVIEDTQPNGFYAGNPARRIAELDDHGNFIKLPNAVDALPTSEVPSIGDARPAPSTRHVTFMAA
jgi:serine acetyltransferase